MSTNKRIPPPGRSGEHLDDQYIHSTLPMERFDGKIIERSGMEYPVRRWVVRGKDGVAELVIYLVPFTLTNGSNMLPVAVNIHSRGPLYVGHGSLSGLCPLLGRQQCWPVSDGTAAAVLLQAYRDVGEGIKGDNLIFGELQNRYRVAFGTAPGH